MADTCISPNADIAGIGIRINFYATLLLTALTPEYENGYTDELLDGIYKNSVINGLSLVITAVVQTGKNQLDLYHAIFVMQILFSLNFVYAYGQRRFIRSDRKDFRMKIFIGVQTFTTVVFTVWLLYVWIKGVDFGSQPSCNRLVKYVLVFVNVRATATWLRVLFIMNLVITACMLSFRFGAILSRHLGRVRKKIHSMREVWCFRFIGLFPRKESQVEEPHELQTPQEQQERGSTPEGAQKKVRYVTFSILYAVYGIATLELIVRRNRSNINPGESSWGFGQIIAVILLLGSIIDIVVVIREWLARRKRSTPEGSSEPETDP